MTIRKIALVALFAGMLAALAGRAEAVDTENLRTKEQAQHRATEMARELVGTILDLQLRQLEENRLQNLQIYTDIKAMRAEIDELVKHEMQDVVALLVKAQSAPRAEAEQHFVEVRAKVRDIVITLATERQKLLRRLRIAKLEAQIRQLIERQTAVRDATGGLLAKPEPQREPLLLAARQDERDIRALYAALESALADVATWGGEVGTEAAGGLGQLRRDKIAGEIDRAVDALDTAGEFRILPEAARYSAATESQGKVIAALRALLPRIMRSRDQVEGDPKAALELVRELTEKQKELREETKNAKLDDTKVADLVKKQAEIREGLEKLREAIQEVPDTEPFVDQAKSASARAEENVFDSQPEAAAKQQDRVLANLAAVEERLSDEVSFSQSDKSADELKKRVADLEKVREVVKKAQQDQASAEKAAGEKPADAKKLEEKVAERLAKADEGRETTAAVKARIDQAEQAATESAQAQKSAQAKPTEASRDAAQKASRAVEQAAAEVETALRTAKRQALGVKIGELARAAEALERAAATENQISRAAQQAGKSEGLQADQAKEMAAEQADVERVAQRTSKGVATTAPEVAKQLEAAGKPIAEAGKQLSKAGKQPGTESKPAAAEASRSAAEAGKQLEKAAADLRGEIAKTADALGEEAGKQLAELGDVSKPVEGAIDPYRSGEAKDSKELGRLAEKAAKVDAGATAALRGAEKAAKEAAVEAKLPSIKLTDTAAAVEQRLERAA
ncbi:MAG: hypothetical protein WD468_04115, partial [Pirellulales bacterium]